MTPHKQTDLGDDTGSCYSTCLACVLDLPVEAVPNFRRIQHETECYDMIQAADKWLRENHGKRILGIEMYDANEGPEKGQPMTRQVVLNRLFFANQDEFVILSGESPRKRADGGKKYHCVVAKADCWGFELVHDPHPDGTGIVGQPYGIAWIVSVN